ncbi:MAG: cell division protein FtsZ [Fibrobacter sp.]|nr:cell division protein FtsZ [Fibrobacter sp.]
MSESTRINFDATSRIMGEDTSSRNAKVKVFGVGGAGGNTVNRMKQMNIEGVEYYAVNTDAMALDLSLADHKIVIGEKTTKGLGAGMEPEKAGKAVEENIEELKEAMKGADMVFVTAGMGGGTGTGAAPIVANVARELGILTVAVVTKPFRFEGNARAKIAQEGIKNLRAAVDTIIVVENKKLLGLLQTSNPSATMEEAFKMADEILGNAVQSICGIMFHHGLVHVDFADIRKVMLKGGSALMGTGCAQGEKRGIAAADLALASPLLEDIDVRGASGVLINVAHGENYSLIEHSDAMEHIYERVGEEGDPNIIIGDITIPEMGDRVSITIIATGCGGSANVVPQAPAQAFNINNVPTGFQTIPQYTYQQPVSVAPAAPVAPAPVAEAPAAPAVQQATPRPTAINFAALAQAQVAPAVAPAPAAPAPQMDQDVFTRRMPAQQPAFVDEKVAPAPETLSEIPALTDTGVMRAVNSAMFGATGFDAMSQAEETVVRGSETSEFSLVTEEDRIIGGRGMLETNYASEPAYVRNTMYATAETVATHASVGSSRTETMEPSMKDSGVDYSLPAYLRQNANLDNF